MNFCKRALLYVGLILLLTPPTLAQHEGHKPPPAKPVATPSPAKPVATPAPAKPVATPGPAKPVATPSATPNTDSMDHAGMDHGLLVVEDDEMFVRVGDSHANL